MLCVVGHNKKCRMGIKKYPHAFMFCIKREDFFFDLKPRQGYVVALRIPAFYTVIHVSVRGRGEARGINGLLVTTATES